MDNDKARKTIAQRQQKEKAAVLEQLREIPIVQVACKRAGIGRASYYRWRAESDTFRKLSDKALRDGVSLINDLSESQLISAIRNGNLTATMYWLRNRHGGYSNRIEVTTHERPEKLSRRQTALLRKALQLSQEEGAVKFMPKPHEELE